MKLLEREIPFQALDNALKKATNGEGRVALVYGEAGIGKTSLVEQFTHQRREAVRVLWAICDALFTPHPLGPLHDIAAQVQSELLTLLRPESSRQAIFFGLPQRDSTPAFHHCLRGCTLVRNGSHSPAGDFSTWL